jgi:hypothetical protein
MCVKADARRERRVTRWAVECDGEREVYGTREAARRAAERWSRHPANQDIRAHGPYRNATGSVAVRDRWYECSSSCRECRVMP